jgi:hypothetical protein
MRQGRGVVQSKSKRLLVAEADIAAAIEAITAKHGIAPSAFVVILANIPNDSGMFDAGRDPFLFRFRGHPSLAQKAAEWVGEQLDAELDTSEEAEKDDEP